MHFFTFILKNLARRAFRSTLTMIGVAVAIGAVVALVGIADGFRKSFIELYSGRNVDLVVSKKGIAERLTSALDENLGQQIAQFEGVREVAPVLADLVSLEQAGEYVGVPLAGWEPGSFMFNALKILEGGKIESSDKPQVMLGVALAENLGKKVGDELSIVEGAPFTVIGVFQSFSVYENSMMVVSLEQLQRLMDRPGQVTAFNILIDKGEDTAVVERIKKEIEALPGGLAALETQEYVSSNMQIQLAQAMAWITSTIALVIGAVGVLNTMVMSVYERTQEIGILRAIGWRKFRVIRMILAESLALSMLGAAAGTLGAVLLARVLSQLPAAGGLVAGSIEPRVVAQGFIVALLVGLMGGAYPAYRGAQLLPTEALRHE